jgi:hypothetical protein
MASERRLIDAEELWKKFESEPWYDNADRDEIALQMVDDAPTVDAVEVVRCKDCKWFKKGTPFRHECNNICAGMFYVRQEDFCSYGERKDNERKAD